MLLQVLEGDVQIPISPVNQQFHYPQFLYDEAPTSVELYYIQPGLQGNDGRPVLSRYGNCLVL